MTDCLQGKIRRGLPDRISTEVYVGRINCSTIDLFSIFQFCDIDSEIIGICYGGKIRGNYSVKGKQSTRSDNFPNQLSLIVNPGFGYQKNSGLNVKIFKNGGIQMSGCKLMENVRTENTSVRQATDVANATMKIVYKKLYDLDGLYQESIYRQYQLIIGKISRRIYNSSGNVIGAVLTRKRSAALKYCFGDDEIDPKLLRSRSFTNLKKNIYNANAEIIGEQVLIFHEDQKQYSEHTWRNYPSWPKNQYIYSNINKTRLMLKPNQETGEIDIYSRFPSEKVGYSLTTFYKDVSVGSELHEKFVRTRFCAINPREGSSVSDAKTSLINGYYYLDFRVNLLKMAKILQDWETVNSSEGPEESGHLLVTYDPDNYHGIRIAFRRNACICTAADCKCKTSIMVFSTGKIMISSKNIDEMVGAYDLIADVISQHKDVCESHVN